MMKRTALAIVVAGSLLSTAARALDVLDCCDWATGWSFSSYGANAGTATATVEPSGGNPGARLNMTTVTPTPADTAFATAVLTTSTMPAPSSGTSFTLSLDVLSGAGAFGQGQAIQLLVQQGSAVYATSLGITGFPLNPFTTLSFGGTFSAASFTLVSGAGPATPSFDGSTSTQFGFAAGNNNSATLTQYYDSFRLAISSGAPGPAAVAVPTLSPWAIAVLGGLLAGIAFLRRTRAYPRR